MQFIVLVNHGVYDEGVREVTAHGPFAARVDAEGYARDVREGVREVDSLSGVVEGASVIPLHHVQVIASR